MAGVPSRGLTVFWFLNVWGIASWSGGTLVLDVRMMRSGSVLSERERERASGCVSERDRGCVVVS